MRNPTLRTVHRILATALILLAPVALAHTVQAARSDRDTRDTMQVAVALLPATVVRVTPEPTAPPVPPAEQMNAEADPAAGPAETEATPVPAKLMPEESESGSTAPEATPTPAPPTSEEPVSDATPEPPPAATESEEPVSDATPEPPPAATETEQGTGHGLALEGIPAMAQTSDGRTLMVAVGRSLTLQSDVSVKRVSISNPAVAEPIAISTDQFLINGLSPGVASLVLWPADQDEAILYDLVVHLDTEALSNQIRSIFPTENVQVRSSKDTIVLGGNVSSPKIAEKVVTLAQDFSGKVIDAMAATPDSRHQVRLRVKFAEVAREALTELGSVLHHVDPTAPFGSDRGSSGTGDFAPPGGNLLNTPVGPDLNWSDAINLSYFEKSIDLGLFITALKRRGLFQELAEPTLITADGQEASFLAGGEFPVPIAQPNASTTSITIEWKKFGISLAFHPTVRDDDVIVMKVRPEVSSLDFANAVVLEGFRIPAVTVRRTETEVELRSGQAFAIAGLYDSSLTETKSKVPILGDIPLLKYLFRSKNLAKKKTELLVIVTPEIVTPLDSMDDAPQVAMPESFELYKKEKF